MVSHVKIIVKWEKMVARIPLSDIIKKIHDVEGTMETRYAPAERASEQTVLNQHELLEAQRLITPMLDVVPNIVLVLNRERQVVYCNRNLLRALKLDDDRSILGMRPGELLHCVHAMEHESGCGTTEFCRYCGAVNAILTSVDGKPDLRECRIIVKNNSATEALDLQVKTTPLDLEDQRFIFFTITDISDQKRRQNLERIFFHDLLNTAGALKNSVELLKEAEDVEEARELVNFLPPITERLLQEIQTQRDLIKAENGELTVRVVDFSVRYMLKDTVIQASRLEVASRQELRIDPDAVDTVIISDPVILGRVLLNMTKNALEAGMPGDVVTLGCDRMDPDGVRFWVNNPAVMTEEVRMQVFQRSFSTKGADRGLGTYSMKLLTERYLHGKIDFSSEEGKGTTFWVLLPMKIEDRGD